MKCLLLFVCLTIGLAAFSQDIIYYKNGRTDTVKIAEINRERVVFSRPPDEQLFSASLSGIEEIHYNNGQVYMNSTPLREEKSDQLKYFRKPNSIALNLIPFLENGVGGLYERISQNKVLGYGIPFYYSYKEPEDAASDIYRIGFDLNLYLIRKKNTCLFFGPAVKFGEENYLKASIPPKNLVRRNFIGVYFTSGILAQVSPDWQLIFNIKFGRRYYFKEKNNIDFIPAVLVSYNF